MVLAPSAADIADVKAAVEAAQIAETKTAIAQAVTDGTMTQDKADWLARHWARPNAQRQWEIAGDAAHKVVNAQLFRLEEVLESYRRISAPTLVVEASDNEMGKWYQGKYTLDEFHERLKAVPKLAVEKLADCGHMLHHDQPEALARAIEGFLAG